MSFTDVMIDIETMGTRSNAAILSIGMLEFDPATAKFGREIEVVFSPQAVQHQLDAGATVTFDTFKWWITEAASMLPQLLEVGKDMRDWHCGLVDVRVFCMNRQRIWAQGPHFDIAILNSSWRLDAANDGGDIISDHWKVRDCRTLAEASGVFAKRVKGQHHNALQDCRAQANAVIQAWGKIGKGGLHVA